MKKVDLLNVARWVADVWNEVQSITIVKSWRKLLDHKASNQWNAVTSIVTEESEDQKKVSKQDSEILSLLQKLPGCDNAVIQDVYEWMSKDDDFEYTDGDIVQLVTRMGEEGTENDNEEEEISSTRTYAITHADGLMV